MSADDWLAPFDDVLTGRIQSCTLCGTRGGAGWLDIAHGPGYAVAVIVCVRCQAADPERRRLDALLRQRYAPGRYHGTCASGRGKEDA
jgi:hypothetical protein